MLGQKELKKKELRSKDVNKWTEYGCCHANILTSFKRMQNSSHITSSTYTCELHGYRITIAMDSNRFLMNSTTEQWHEWNFAFGYENCACKCISAAHVLFETLNFVLFKGLWCDMNWVHVFSIDSLANTANKNCVHFDPIASTTKRFNTHRGLAKTEDDYF